MHTSLATIGRLPPVECDDPPSDNEYGHSRTGAFSSDGEENESQQPFPTLSPEDLRDINEISSRKFSYLRFYSVTLGQNVLNVNMPHCEGVQVAARILGDVFRAEDGLARLELRRQVATRLQEFESCVMQIRRLNVQEFQLLDSCKRDGNCGSAKSRLGYLRSLCDGLRLCLNQAWTLCSYVQQNRALQRTISSVKVVLEGYMSHHQQLSTAGVLSVYELINTGLLVLSHSDLSKYDHDELWEIARGIEEFNIILEHVKHQRRFRLYRRLFVETPHVPSPRGFLQLEVSLEGVDLLKPVSFSRILHRLASERSANIVDGLHDFFYSYKDLVKLLKHRNMEDLSSDLLDTAGTTGHHKETGQSRALRTSDYHSETVSNGSPSNRKAVHSRCSKLVARMVKAGSPVGDYLQVEYEFASGFLDIISQSTEMLKDLHNPRKKRFNKDETMETLIGSVSPIAAINASPATKPRKGVQWSDHNEVTVRPHVIGQYLDLVWKEVARQLECDKGSHNHSSNKDLAKVNLGSHLVLPPATQLFIANIISEAAASEVFPPALVPTLMEHSAKIKMTAVVTLWDQNMCQSLGAGSSLTLQPTLLAGNVHCTKCCKALLDAMEPIVSLLRFLMDTIQGVMSVNRGLASSAVLAPHMSRVSSVINLLLAGARTGLAWCQNRSAALLASWKPGPLMFIVHTDLRLLGDQLSRTLTPLSRLNVLPLAAGEAEFAQIRADVKRLSDIQKSIQELSNKLMISLSTICSTTTLDRLSNRMPKGRAWRSKNPPDPLSSSPSRWMEAQDYAVELVETILDEVVSGVAKLDLDTQVAAIGPAMDALCSAWSRFILKEKIKFSYWGACQLESDVSSISRWITGHVTCHEARMSLLSRDSLRDLEAGVQLVKRQNSSITMRSCSRRRTGRSDGRSNSTGDTSSVGEPPKSTTLPPAPQSATEGLDLEDFYFLSTRADWLALRLSPEEGRRFLPICH